MSAERLATMTAASNYETALKAEMKRVVRNWQPYTHEQRADMSASFRLGYRQRQSTGHHFYTHPDIPGRAFDRRKQAAEAAMSV